MFFLIARFRAVLRETILHGYAMSRSKSGQPTLLAKPGERVMGVLATDLDDAVVKRLDGFYGPNYRKKRVRVFLNGSGVAADVYVLRPRPDFPEGIIDLSAEG